MKANPLALVLGALFGAVGYFVGIKLTSRQAENRDAGPLPDANGVPISTPETGNPAESVTEELPK